MRPLPGLSLPHGPLTDYLNAHVHSFARAEIMQHWSQRRLAAALASGAVIRILPGVYCGARHERHPIVMGEALNLWHPPGLVTGALALHLYSSRLPAPRRAQLLVAAGQHLRAPAWVRLIQAGPLRQSSAPRGIHCTAPERALLDAWRHAPPSSRRDLLWEALWSRVCTWRQLARELERTPRVAGRRDLEQVLGWFEAGATTPLEAHAKHVTFTDARFRDFVWQVELRLRRRRVTVDMLHRAAMVVVELDGDAYHSTREARDADRERQTELAAAGYAVARFGWRDIMDRPDWCRAQVLDVVGHRLAAPRSA